MAMMKAAVIHSAGGPEILKIESLPIPQPRNDEFLVRVKAFGLNRSELFRISFTSTPGISRAMSADDLLDQLVAEPSGKRARAQ